VNTSDEVKDAFFSHWSKNGFREIDPIPVIPSSNWQYTFFVNSGLIRYLELIKEYGYLSSSFFNCQPCVKVGTSYLSLQDMVMKDGYFTFFKQLSCGGNKMISPSWFIERVYSYLVEVIGLSAERIHVGVSQSCPKFVSSWTELGIPAENVLYPDPEAFVLNLEDGNIRGEYNPFYYDRGEQQEFACRESSCGINCSCGRFLELGDIGVIYAGNERIIDHGIGLERMLSVRQNLGKVSDVEEFQRVLAALREFGIKGNGQLFLIADHLRTAVLLLSFGLKPGNKGRDYVLRCLLRRAFWAAHRSGCLDEIINLEIYRSLSSILKLQLTKKVVSVWEVFCEVKKEHENLRDLMTRGVVAVRRLKKKSKDFSDEVAVFLYETHGLPREIAEDLFLSVE